MCIDDMNMETELWEWERLIGGVKYRQVRRCEGKMFRVFKVPE